MESLAEALPKEMARVRDEVMPCYREVGMLGRPALFFMQKELDEAVKAIMNGDLPEMIRLYQSLKGWNV